MIYVWYHCDGASPEWEIPEIAEITNGTYRYGGRAEHHANTHVQVLIFALSFPLRFNLAS